MLFRSIDIAIQNTSIKVLVVNKDLYKYLLSLDAGISCIVCEFPEDFFYQLHEKLYSLTSFYISNRVDPVFGNEPNIHSSVVIESGVVIGNNVTIGPNSVICAGSHLDDGVRIGACCVIGGDGFQIIRNMNGVPRNIKHVGKTYLGSNVWLGDCVTICNSIFEGSVKIGSNTQIGNHTQIAHNCTVGINNVITSGVIMLGSSELKDECWIAPGSLVMNKVIVESKGIVGVNSLVSKCVKSGDTVVGSPAVLLSQFKRERQVIRELIK